MKPWAAIILSLACAACAGSATPDGGVATYDAIKNAQDECVARGGQLKLVRDGDPQVLADWTCKRK
jgi:hypothetical protein